MLPKVSAMPDAFDAKVQAYFNEALGLGASVHVSAIAGDLPYYLQDSFDWRDLDLAGHSILLAIDRLEAKPSLADIKSRLNKARRMVDRPVVYATNALASYERRYLITEKVPFVVPGNQLYLPDLGIDLREYFRQRQAAPETTLSPAAQATLTSLLLNPASQEGLLPAELADTLGYTPMTLSRAIRELTTTGLVTTLAGTRYRKIRLAQLPSETWERALPWMRSPIKRVAWADPTTPALQNAPLAGLSAISHYTSLAEPKVTVRAVTLPQWKSALAKGLQVVPEWQPGTIEWQIWQYDPALGKKGKIVDPLSLTLSTRDAGDERIQMALSELREQFPW